MKISWDWAFASCLPWSMSSSGRVGPAVRWDRGTTWAVAYRDGGNLGASGRGLEISLVRWSRKLDFSSCSDTLVAKSLATSGGDRSLWQIRQLIPGGRVICCIFMEHRLKRIIATSTAYETQDIINQDICFTYKRWGPSSILAPIRPHPGDRHGPSWSAGMHETTHLPTISTMNALRPVSFLRRVLRLVVLLFCSAPTWRRVGCRWTCLKRKLAGCFRLAPPVTFIRCCSHTDKEQSSLLASVRLHPT